MTNPINIPGMGPVSGKEPTGSNYITSIGKIAGRTISAIGEALSAVVEKVKTIMSEYQAQKAEAPQVRNMSVTIRPRPPLTRQESTTEYVKMPTIGTHRPQAKKELSFEEQREALKGTGSNEKFGAVRGKVDLGELHAALSDIEATLEHLEAPPAPPPREEGDDTYFGPIPSPNPRAPEREEGDDDLGPPPELPERAPEVPERNEAVDSPGKPPAPPPRDVIVDNSMQSLFASAMGKRREALGETSQKVAPPPPPPPQAAKIQEKAEVTEKGEPAIPAERPAFKISGNQFAEQLAKLKKTEIQEKVQDKTGGLENKRMLDRTKESPDVVNEPLREESEWED
jgi:hypothetical protein